MMWPILQNGNTSLHEAVKNDFLDVVQILIEKECRINVRNKLSQTPMDIASVNGFSNIVILLAGLQVIEVITIKVKNHQTLLNPQYSTCYQEFHLWHAGMRMT